MLWSAYLHQDSIHSIIEREKLYKLHETPSHFKKEGKYNIVLFVESVDNPVNAIDTSKNDEYGDPEYTTKDLIALLMTHNTPNAVLMRSDQATAVYNVLHVPTEEGMV